MAQEVIFCDMQLSNLLIQELDQTFNKKVELKDSLIGSHSKNYNIRNSKSGAIPANHWICSIIWYYVNKINSLNFMYDISSIEGDSLQYICYDVGQFYSWHVDGNLTTQYSRSISEYFYNTEDYLKQEMSIDNELVRKLSFSVQLSDPDEYEGGELQFMKGNSHTFFAPKDKGHITIFDSRVNHRVKKVKKGVRKSLVGWVVGPRWK